MAEFDESDIPKEVPAHEDYEVEPENAIRGHKAAIANPSMSCRESNCEQCSFRPLTLCITDVSEQAKERSRKVLEQYDEPYDESTASHGATQQKEKDPGNVARGLKASISNPGVSDEAKAKAKEKLQGLE